MASDVPISPYPTSSPEPSPPAIDRPEPRAATEAEFRAAARCYAAGVTVVTTTDDGIVDGITVSAFTTLSMRPMLVLVSLGNRGLFLRRVLGAGVFAVNILGGHQRHVARYFADGSRPRTLTRFPGIGSDVAVTGAPILTGCLGWVDCVVSDGHDHGDHRLVIGEVRSAASTLGPPLLRHDGEYHTLV